jgi:hypothetical protein
VFASQERGALLLPNPQPLNLRYLPRFTPYISVKGANSRTKAARTLALQAAYRKAEANIKRDDAPSAGEIRRLGVLDAPLEEKNLKASKWFPHKEIN